MRGRVPRITVRRTIANGLAPVNLAHLQDLVPQAARPGASDWAGRERVDAVERAARPGQIEVVVRAEEDARGVGEARAARLGRRRSGRGEAPRSCSAFSGCSGSSAQARWLITERAGEARQPRRSATSAPARAASGRAGPCRYRRGRIAGSARPACRAAADQACDLAEVVQHRDKVLRARIRARSPGRRPFRTAISALGPAALRSAIPSSRVRDEEVGAARPRPAPGRPARRRAHRRRP